MEDGGRYIVVFRYTKKAGDYHGIITWTSYPTEEEFNKIYTQEEMAYREVVEKGVTQERAIELTRQTPFACRIAAASQDATDADGNFNPIVFRVEVEKAVFAEMFSTKTDYSKK